MIRSYTLLRLLNPDLGTKPDEDDVSTKEATSDKERDERERHEAIVRRLGFEPTRKQFRY